jgi:hypothetical protein
LHHCGKLFLEELTRVEELSRKIDCGESLSKKRRIGRVDLPLRPFRKKVMEGLWQLFQEKWGRYPEKIREQIDQEKRSEAFRRNLKVFEQDRRKKLGDG